MAVKAVFIGFGARGQCYANYTFQHKNEFEVAAVAEPKAHLRKLAVEQYGCPADKVYESWNDLLADGVMGDLLFVCTQDNHHVEPAILAMEAGYRYLMVEKPIDKDIDQCRLLMESAHKYDATVQVCHSLRYTNFYRKLKELLDNDAVGKIKCINHTEALGTFHYAHSFVRGDWNWSQNSSPMILAKCCHDTDLLLWLTGKHCKRVYSEGSQSFFNSEHAPADAPDRCINGCPHISACPYSATKYLSKYRNHLFREYAVEKEGFTTTEEALQKGRYGRCVFRCDNDVVDHQIVVLEFEDNITASLTMSGFSNFGRETHIMGTMGEIRAYMDDSKIIVYDFRAGNKTTYDIGHPDSLHSGADTILVRDAVAVVRGYAEPATSIDISVESHAMCIAAEQSRISGEKVTL